MSASWFNIGYNMIPGSSSDRVELSLCISTYLSCDYLRACLTSVYLYPPACSYEIVVVNDYSGDGTAEMVQEEFPEVVFIENREQVGNSKAYNMGFQHSKGKYILLLDADAELIMDTVKSLMDFMYTHPDAGMVTCRLVYPDGSPQPSGQRYLSIRRLIWQRLVTLLRLPIDFYHHRYRNYDAVEEVDDVPFTCLLIRRELGEPNGYLDENIFLFYPDVDLSYRVKSEGWKIYQIPYCKVLHHRGVNRKKPSARVIVNGYRDEVYFFRKWYASHQVFFVKLIQTFEVMIRMVSWTGAYLMRSGQREMMRERCRGGITILKFIWFDQGVP